MRWGTLYNFHLSDNLHRKKQYLRCHRKAFGGPDFNPLKAPHAIPMTLEFEDIRDFSLGLIRFLYIFFDHFFKTRGKGKSAAKSSPAGYFERLILFVVFQVVLINQELVARGFAYPTVPNEGGIQSEEYYAYS